MRSGCGKKIFGKSLSQSLGEQDAGGEKYEKKKSDWERRLFL